MRFGVLGPLRVGDEFDGAVRGLRLRALLTLLLLDAGRIVPADRLIDGVYGEDPPRGAANALQSQVSRLRQILPRDADGAPMVEFHPGGYRIAVDPDDVDVHRFTRLVREARAAAQAEDNRGATRLFGEALAQWRGQALTDVAELPFAGPQAARLEEQHATVVEDYAAARLALGQPSDILERLQAQADAYPFRERTWALLIRALGSAGRHAEALAAFATVREALSEELGADPAPELTQAHLAVLRGEVAPAATAPERWGMRHQFTTFVGRENDVRRVSSLLDTRQLVTLVGPGGAGKTRLAFEVADDYPGDVGFVDLSSRTEEADIAQVILGTLELRESSLRAKSDAPPSADRLEKVLADRALLLVLDNCEHLIGPVASLVSRLLGVAPALRILATSREPLGMTGEALHRLYGLSLPPGDGDIAVDIEHLRESAAVRLFVERGRDAEPDFTLTERNTAAVLRICRRLDGLPLGIELAAARLRSLPIDEIARRLDDRFQLLSRGSRTAQARHQTLRAVVEWSWDLLSREEQRLCQRFTVFAGGADLAAVEVVCSPHDSDPGATNVVETLSGLVDKSLVESDGRRYRMLDTVHAFCSERLEESGEEEAMWFAHMAYFLEFAQTAEPWLRRVEQLDWLTLLDTDRDNLHVAVRRATALGDVRTAARMVASLSQYWWLRGMRWEASAMAGEVYDLFGPEVPSDLREDWAACFLLASLTRTDQEMMRSREHLRVAIWEWALTLEEPPRYPFVYYLFALASGPPASLKDARVGLVDQISPQHGTWLHALTLVGAGSVVRTFGWRGMESALRQSVAVFEDLGDRWGMTLAHSVLAEELGADGRPAEGIAALDQALSFAYELQAVVDIPDLLRSRGSLYLDLDYVSDARADFEAAIVGARHAGDPENVAGARLGLAKLALREGDVGAARDLSRTALAECPTGWFVADEIRADIVDFIESLDSPPLHE